MSKIPFTIYDFFAYLSAGGVVVAALDSVFGGQWLARNDLGVGTGLLLALASYVLGHVIAHFSKFALQDVLVARLLGQPSAALLGVPAPKGIRLIFPGYYRSLPAETQERIRQRAAMAEAPTSGEGLFLHAYGVVARDRAAQERLDEFRNLYGFARNMTVALMVAAIVLAIGGDSAGFPNSTWWALASSVLGVAMCYRYLKFFRQFTFQLFITFAESRLVM